VRLLQQPDDGVKPLVNAIDNAQKSIELMVFRFDQKEIERALKRAVSRGVAVRAQIAHVNGSGEDALRRVEMRLLAAGVTVSRSDDGFVRYHAKLMIVDRKELFLLAFNLTQNDILQSRSFGVITADHRLVAESLKLFEADVRRQTYEPGLSTFIVSPANAREELGAFIEGAEKELLIYDPRISDPAMLGRLRERSKAGVDIKVIGQVTGKGWGIGVRKLATIRLHTRSMIRDRKHFFIGSQSLREAELDRRREVGAIFDDAPSIEKLVATFLDDWRLSEAGSVRDSPKPRTPATKVAKRVAKAVSRELPPIAPVLEGTMKELQVETAELALDAAIVEEAVREAVKEAVKEAVRDVVEEAETNGVPA